MKSIARDRQQAVLSSRNQVAEWRGIGETVPHCYSLAIKRSIRSLSFYCGVDHNYSAFLYKRGFWLVLRFTLPYVRPTSELTTIKKYLPGHGPSHEMETSLVWLQDTDPHGECWQSSSMISCPVQFTLSSQIRPSPGPCVWPTNEPWNCLQTTSRAALFRVQDRNPLYLRRTWHNYTAWRFLKCTSVLLV